MCGPTSSLSLLIEQEAMQRIHKLAYVGNNYIIGNREERREHCFGTRETQRQSWKLNVKLKIFKSFD